MSRSAPEPVLVLRQLTWAHPGQPALFECWSCRLPAGLTRLDLERGKSTLLQVLAGALPAGFDATLNGKPWHPASQPEAVCLVDPRDAAWQALTPDAVRDAVRARHPTFDASRWQQLAEAFELGEHRHKTMHMLSTGTRRKVALAAALAAQAPLTLLDEPVAGLDAPARDVLVRALADEAAVAGGGRAWLLAAAWGLEDRLPWAALIDG